MDKIEKIAEIYCQNCRDNKCDDRCNCETCYKVAHEIQSLLELQGDVKLL